MSFLALLSDRPLRVVLPALEELNRDLKLEPLAASSLGHVVELDADAVLVDAVENPGQAWSLLQQARARDRRLRAKRGPEHEHLVETVRSVGYRAAEI